MKTFQVALLFFVLFSFITQGQEIKSISEDQQAILLEIGWLQFFLIDWAQTRRCANYDKLLEMNPILGPFPSQRTIDVYFSTVLVFHPIISYYLPGEWRKYWQIATTAVEIKATLKNFRLLLFLKL